MQLDNYLFSFDMKEFPVTLYRTYSFSKLAVRI